MSQTTRFAGKVALITGASSGIGKASALAFGREGAKVVVASRRTEEGEETAQLVREAGGEATFIQVDVSQGESVKALVQKTLETYGRLDVAFNNAGVEGVFAPLTDLEEDVWNHTIDINLKGAWLSLKYEIPAILQSGGGAIVFNASIAGSVGLANASIYSASKMGVIGLAKSAAIEYADRNIRINVISPGAIETPMAGRAFGSTDAFNEFMAPRHPIGRVGRPEEVADAAVFLAADSASFITGHVLAVDGGYMAQ